MKLFLTCICFVGTSLCLFSQTQEKKTALEEAHRLAQAGQFAKADSLYQMLSSAFYQGKDDSLWGIASYQNFRMFFRSERYSKAQEVAQREIARMETESIRDSTLYAKWFSRNAYAYNRLGLYHKSIQSFEKGFFCKEFDQHLYTEYLLLPASVAYAKLDDQETAILLAEEALEYFEDREDFNGMNRSYSNIAEYLYLKEDLSKSLDIYNKVQFHKKAKDSWLHICSAELGKSRVYLKLDSLEKALDSFQKFEQASSKIQKKDLKFDELMLDGIIASADLLVEQELHKKAHSAFQKYIKSSAQVYEKQNARELAKSHNAYGDYLFQIGDFEIAKEKYKKAANCFDAFKPDMQYLHARSKRALSLANLYLNHKRNLSANEIIAEIESVLDLFPPIQEIYRDDQSKFVLSSSMKSLSEIGIEILHELYTKTANTEFALKALQMAEESQAVVLKDQSNQALEQSLIESDYKRFRILQNSKGKVLNEIYKLKSSQKGNRIKRLEKEMREIDIELNEFLSVKKQKGNQLNSAPKSLLTEIDENQLIDGFLYFFHSGKNLFRLAYLEKELLFEKILIDENIEKNIKDFKSSFEFVNRHHFNIKSAKLLFEKLIPQKLDINGKNILIIPDENVLNLPFECFVNEHEEYLIRQTDFFYANALSLGIENAHSQGTNHEISIFRPTFTNDQKLEFAKEETDEISTIFQSKIFQDDSASRENFLNRINDFEVIHLSTHAYLDSNLATSYIAFSKDSLYLQELYNSHFNARLVTLSACETSLGEVQGTEGSLSLSRAFIYAGVSSTVSSLWKVNDKANSDIISRFYNNLSTHSISSSLGQAKRSYLEDKDVQATLKTPYYWAGIVHYGNDQIVKIKRNKNAYYLWLFAALGALMLYFLLKRKRLFESE